MRQGRDGATDVLRAPDEAVVTRAWRHRWPERARRGLVAVAAAAAVVTSWPQPSEACDATPFLGDVCPVAYAACPQGFAAANGQLLPIGSNQPLFSLLGTTFGGDGIDTFALPDLRGR